MGKKWTIAAGIFAFALLAVVVANVTPDAPELSLRFEGYEANGVARFCISNGSTRTIEYLGPSSDVHALDDSSAGLCGLSAVPPRIAPRTNRLVRIFPPDHPCAWKALLMYEARERVTDKARLWLWNRHITIAGYPDRSRILTSQVLTNATTR